MKLLRTENDIVELAGRVQDSLTSIDDTEQMEKAVEFTVQSIIGRQISLYDGLLTKKRQQLDEAIVKLQEELDGYDGSEVKDVRVQRATGWVRQQEQQLEFLQDYVEADMKKAMAAYESFFGKRWMRYSETRNLAESKKNTATKADATALIEKYKK